MLNKEAKDQIKKSRATIQRLLDLNRKLPINDCTSVVVLVISELITEIFKDLLQKQTGEDVLSGNYVLSIVREAITKLDNKMQYNLGAESKEVH